MAMPNLSSRQLKALSESSNVGGIADHADIQPFERAQIGVEIDEIDARSGAARCHLSLRQPPRQQDSGHTRNIWAMAGSRDHDKAALQRFAMLADAGEDHVKAAAS